MAAMNTFKLASPATGATLPIHRNGIAKPSVGALRQRHVARAGGFDEGAAQVRRLLDRDRKELDFDELENAFASPKRDGESPANGSDVSTAASSVDPSQEATPANSGSRFAADKSFVSPFGPSSTSQASPFGGPSAPTRKPFNEPAGLSPTMQPDVIDETPWWTKISVTQIVIALSFTTIISLMIATFFFVVKVGAVRFNE